LWLVVITGEVPWGLKTADLVQATCPRQSIVYAINTSVVGDAADQVIEISG